MKGLQSGRMGGVESSAIYTGTPLGLMSSILYAYAGLDSCGMALDVRLLSIMIAAKSRTREGSSKYARENAVVSNLIFGLEVPANWTVLSLNLTLQFLVPESVSAFQPIDGITLRIFANPHAIIHRLSVPADSNFLSMPIPCMGDVY